MMYYDSLRARSRPPLREARNRANILRGAREQPHEPSSSPPAHKYPMSIRSSEVSSANDVVHSAAAALPPTVPPQPARATAAENKRLSTVAESQPNSNRNSAISSTSTASGKSKRKTHIGPWQLGRTLGKGATGRVRLAKHALTGQTAAIKIVSKKSAAMVQSQSIAAMDKNIELTTRVPGGRVIPSGIEREVVIMKLIEHPNIINLYDVWENRGELYLVLEYVEGGELFDYVSESGPLPEIEAVRLFRQIIAALSYCHRFNICHRDLKPENILLDTNCNIKLADFGMAALQPAGHWLNTSCGSPHYASPEIIYGHRYQGDKADIWSCGIILFAMLTGYLPFDGGDLPNTLRLVKKGEYIFPPWLSVEAMDLIQRILQKQPRDRISIDEMWSHPLLKKYEKHHILMTSEGASLGPPPPLSYKDCGKKITRRQDIDMELLRSLQTLWHGAKVEELIGKLLSDEVNHEKMFYHALAKFRDDQLENYEGPLGYSASDYHHISRGPAKSQPRATSSRNTSQSWRRSQLSIATGRSTFREASHPEPKSARTIASYDPYRSSRSPISNPQAEFANVTVHRQSPDSLKSKGSDSSSQASNSPSHFTLKKELPKDRRSFAPSSSIGANRWNRKGSISSIQSRSSIASSTRRRNGFTGPRSASYKRNVCFRHVRNQRSIGRQTTEQPDITQTHSQSSVPPETETRDKIPSDRFSSPALPTPPPPIRVRRNPNHEMNKDPAKQRIAGQYWRDEAIKVSAELGKICEEAFNRTSTSSSAPSVETARQTESPPTSVSTPQEVSSPEDQYKMRPLPEPPADSFNSYTIRELADTRRRLIEHSAQATSDDISQYLSEVIAHLDRLIGDELAPKADNIPKPCPEALSRTSESFLPSIAEDAIFNDCTSIIEKIQCEAKTPEYGDSKITNWKSENTIRMVPHESSIPDMDAIKPLTIRKKSGSSSTQKKNPSANPAGRYRSVSGPSDDEAAGSAPTSRRSSNTRYYTSGLEPIEENPRSPDSCNDARNSGESWKWPWFKHRSLSQEQIPPPPPSKDDAPCLATASDDNNQELGKRKSLQELLELGRRKSVQGLLELGKRRSAPGLLESDEHLKTTKTDKLEMKVGKSRFWQFRRRISRKQNLVHETAEGVNDPNVPTEVALPVSPLPSRASSSITRRGTKKNESHHRSGNQNWFARFFHIKPASKTLAFKVSKLRAIKEVVKILHEWNKYGMEDVYLDRANSIVTGRVAELNFLRLRPVEFCGEFFTVLERGRHANLSLLHLRQERGAASSFHRVANTLEIVLKKRALLVDNSSKAKRMIKVLY
ncbi:serine/threonine-protein kinase [Histoplasma capsulatum G186AR]|uniref:non-specific serine/threonine protein kinase n=1 Tax=Ajellomyces capsulatus TaxID=5037 RepID=A0A8H8CXD6_AJECA|nr:serine/threonine-protein kinase [Histoplasma capsulatum]QSS74687.1 serine/threonine-protein kinase [Histoplasma capsulatum G186AR]